jgi:hypothetical protein
MKRRQFIQHSILSSTAFTGTLIFGSQQPAEGIILLLGRLALETLFGMFLEGAFDFASGKLQQRREQWFAQRLEAQLAQQELITKNFAPSIYVAEVEVSEYKYVLATSRQQYLGKNVVFSFPRLVNSEPVITKIEGPAAYGIAYAAKYLEQNTRMKAQDIRRAILPPVTAAAHPFDNWQGWDAKGLVAYPNDYSSAGVKVRYEPISAKQGGKGIIEITITAEREISLDIPVQFA